MFCRSSQPVRLIPAVSKQVPICDHRPCVLGNYLAHEVWRKLDAQHLLQSPSCSEPPLALDRVSLKAVRFPEPCIRGLERLYPTRPAQPACKVAPGIIVVDDKCGAARSHDSLKFGDARLGFRPEEIREARVSDINAGVVYRKRLRGSTTHLDIGERCDANLSSSEARAMRLHADYSGGAYGKPRQMKTGATPDVQDSFARPGSEAPHRNFQLAFTVSGEVLPLVDIGVLLDIRGRVDAGQKTLNFDLSLLVELLPAHNRDVNRRQPTFRPRTKQRGGARNAQSPARLILFTQDDTAPLHISGPERSR